MLRISSISGYILANMQNTNTTATRKIINIMSPAIYRKYTQETSRATSDENITTLLAVSVPFARVTGEPASSASEVEARRMRLRLYLFFIPRISFER